MQSTFSELEYTAKNKVALRDRFLAEMGAVVPWSALKTDLEASYLGGGRGCPPVGLERMLRTYSAQQCSGLCDEMIEGAIYGALAIRRFVGGGLGRGGAPDATTLLKSRRLEKNQITRRIFEAINVQLPGCGQARRVERLADALVRGHEVGPAQGAGR